MSELQNTNKDIVELQQLKQNATTYSGQISRNQPTALVLLLDQSGSMSKIIPRTRMFL